MKLHLVNGFLGSGKTTAIIAATRRYMQQDKKVAIVTNDKGRYQVDADFFQTAHIPTSQVAGGCFRCSFDEFKEQISQLSHTAHPDILFAESVGSCVDLVNTVFPPLQSLPDIQIDASTFTVFTDIRLFRRWLYGEPMPFSDSIVYTFGKQIDETQMLVLNKMDLLPSDICRSIYEEANRRFPEKRVVLQNSLQVQEDLPWFEYLNETDQAPARPDFQVDYTQYMDSEKKMAWYDQMFTIRSGEIANIRHGVVGVIANLLHALISQVTPVAHLKFFISNSSETVKLSFTAMDLMPGSLKGDWQNEIPQSLSSPTKMIINARVEMKSQLFKDVVNQAIQRVSITEGVKIIALGGSLYHPEVLPSAR
jgi:G3E family GTPase